MLSHVMCEVSNSLGTVSIGQLGNLKYRQPRQIRQTQNRSRASKPRGGAGPTAAGHPGWLPGWGVATALGLSAQLIGTLKPENPALELCVNAHKSASRRRGGARAPPCPVAPAWVLVTTMAGLPGNSWLAQALCRSGLSMNKLLFLKSSWCRVCHGVSPTRLCSRLRQGPPKHSLPSSTRKTGLKAQQSHTPLLSTEMKENL